MRGVPPCRPALLILLALTGALLTPAARPAPAAVREEGPVAVIHSGKLGRTAAWVREETPGALAELSRDLGGSPPEAVTVVLVDRARGGDPSIPEGLPDWVAGFAVPGESAVWLKTSAAVEGGPADLRRTLVHELTHLYLRRRIGGRPLPRWLQEGLAMRQAGEHGILGRINLTAAAFRGDLPRPSSLEGSFPAGRDTAHLAYAVSFSFVSRLESGGGSGAWRELLDRVAGGEDFEGAFRRVFGRPLAAMETEWLASLTRRSRWVGLLAGGSTIWFFMSLLFLLGYWSKRRRSRALLKAMEEEERDEWYH